MKLKLTKAEMQELELIIDNALDNLVVKQDGTIEMLLIQVIFEKFYAFIVKKLFILKKHYTFDMDAIYAFSFLLFFKNATLNPKKFSDNLILKLINQIQKKYGIQNYTPDHLHA